jgi:hypothetical protein
MSKRNIKVKKRDDTSSKAKFARAKRKEPKAATKGEYNSIEYDSLDELGALQWLFELKNQGYITKIERAESFLLCDGVTNDYAELKKSKVSSKPMQQTILHGHSYTPEFKVLWTIDGARKFVWDPESRTKFDKLFIGWHGDSDDWDGEVPKNKYPCICYIEVKPSFDRNNMERLFKLNQKWMWQQHEIFVNLVKINDLFQKTFTPKGYLRTPTGRTRILKWKPRTLNNYLNDK